mmetsp:Transcript_12142/g.20140  ORF Transcript_12142/g.20140 Transcript_12142/m.20140 type:complete len:206 (+) Transcript_12142:95-712(+)
MRVEDVPLQNCLLLEHKLSLGGWCRWRRWSRWCKPCGIDVALNFQLIINRHIHRNGVTVRIVTPQDALGDGRLQLSLDSSLQWTSPIDRIEPDVCQMIQRPFAHAHGDLTVRQPHFQLASLELDNLAKGWLTKTVENDVLIDTIQEFRFEVIPHSLINSFTHQILVIAQVENILASNVAGKNNDRVSEIDDGALAVGNAAIIEHL